MPLKRKKFSRFSGFDYISCENASLNEEIRKVRNQTVSPSEQDIKRSNTTDYDTFMVKYKRLPDSAEGFTTKDLVYFFREKASESGVKYVINNFPRDMAIFKRLKDNYSIPEILLMIEFLFSGDQTYIKTSGTAPTVLISGWGNKIYSDSILWADDEYIEQPKKKDRTSKREWNKSADKKSYSKIGEWEE